MYDCFIHGHLNYISNFKTRAVEVVASLKRPSILLQPFSKAYFCCVYVEKKIKLTTKIECNLNFEPKCKIVILIDASIISEVLLLLLAVEVSCFDDVVSFEGAGLFVFAVKDDRDLVFKELKHHVSAGQPCGAVDWRRKLAEHWRVVGLRSSVVGKGQRAQPCRAGSCLLADFSIGHVDHLISNFLRRDGALCVFQYRDTLWDPHFAKFSSRKDQ